jgi:hypothetical protein
LTDLRAQGAQSSISDSIIEDLSPGELATVVELQRVELNRLLSEQKRLNDRIDLLLQLQECETGVAPADAGITRTSCGSAWRHTADVDTINAGRRALAELQAESGGT